MDEWNRIYYPDISSRWQRFKNWLLADRDELMAAGIVIAAIIVLAVFLK